MSYHPAIIFLFLICVPLQAMEVTPKKQDKMSKELGMCEPMLLLNKKLYYLIQQDLKFVQLFSSFAYLKTYKDLKTHVLQHPTLMSSAKLKELFNFFCNSVDDTSDALNVVIGDSVSDIEIQSPSQDESTKKSKIIVTASPENLPFLLRHMPILNAHDPHKEINNHNLAPEFENLRSENMRDFVSTIILSKGLKGYNLQLYKVVVQQLVEELTAPSPIDWENIQMPDYLKHYQKIFKFRSKAFEIKASKWIPDYFEMLEKFLHELRAVEVKYYEDRQKAIQEYETTYKDLSSMVASHKRSLGFLLRTDIQDNFSPLLPPSFGPYPRFMDLNRFLPLSESLLQITIRHLKNNYRDYLSHLNKPSTPRRTLPGTKMKSRHHVPTKQSKQEDVMEHTEGIQTPSPAIGQGSVRIEELPHYVRIEDTMRDIVYILYKVHMESKPIRTFQWAERVKDWFKNDGQEALIKQGYCEEGHKNYTLSERRYNAVVRHSFPRELDRFLHSLSIQESMVNPKTGHLDLHLTIPGEIRYREKDGSLYQSTVLFTQAIDIIKKTCYHHCATERIPNAIYQEFIKTGKWHVEHDHEEALA